MTECDVCGRKFVVIEVYKDAFICPGCKRGGGFSLHIPRRKKVKAKKKAAAKKKKK
jgi:hypothetical protein